MTEPHWRASITREGSEDPVVSCHGARGEAVEVIRRRLTSVAKGFAEQGRADAEAGARAALANLNDDDFAPYTADPAGCIDIGPMMFISGVCYTVNGCDGEACEVEWQETRTYTAFNGHRMTAPLERHPRTGKVIFDYKGDPKYSQVNARHAADCGCLDPEEGDGGADFAAVDRWEFPGDYE